MRRYAAVYGKAWDSWGVIFNDPNEEHWYIEVPFVLDRDTAELVVTGLSADARQ